MVDVRPAKQAYENGDISDVGWIQSDYNLAEGLTKMVRCRVLEEFMDTGAVNTPIEHLVVRGKLADVDSPYSGEMESMTIDHI